MSNCLKAKECPDCLKSAKALQRCEFWGEDSVMACHDPALYKMTYFGYWPSYPDVFAIWYCKGHYEVMAESIRADADCDDPKMRQRVQRHMEVNNWFQHE